MKFKTLSPYTPVFEETSKNYAKTQDFETFSCKYTLYEKILFSRN